MRGVDDKARAVVIFNVIKDNSKIAFFPFSIFSILDMSGVTRLTTKLINRNYTLDMEIYGSTRYYCYCRKTANVIQVWTWFTKCRIKHIFEVL